MAAPCGLSKWRTPGTVLMWHDCIPPSNASLAPSASLDEQLAYLRPLLNADHRYKIGKHSRNQLGDLLDAVRTATGDTSLSGEGWQMLTCMLTYSYGQNREGLLLWPTLMKIARLHRDPSRRGTFVELGALDGQTLSNTYMLERCHGWRGLLIEAVPENFAKLLKSPRNVSKVHSAVCSDGRTSVRMTTGVGNYGAMAELASLAPVFDKKQHWKKVNESSTIAVPCTTLSKLMHASKLAHGADFLSLDVEGAEEMVLAAVDPAAFRLVLVEDTPGPTKEVHEKNERVYHRLTRAGMQFTHHLHANSVYIRNDTLPKLGIKRRPQRPRFLSGGRKKSGR